MEGEWFGGLAVLRLDTQGPTLPPSCAATPYSIVGIVLGCLNTAGSPVCPCSSGCLPPRPAPESLAAGGSRPATLPVAGWQVLPKWVFGHSISIFTTCHDPPWREDTSVTLFVNSCMDFENADILYHGDIHLLFLIFGLLDSPLFAIRNNVIMNILK